MFFNRLVLKRREPASGTLKAIFVSVSAGEPMRSIDSVEAIDRRGLQGDRYSEDRGHWKSVDGCQVTLITEDELERAKKGGAPDLRKNLDHGGHRRNLVISGLKAKQLEGKHFRVGAAVFRYDKPRPPCAYLDKISGAGMVRALGLCSGVCLRVVTGGRLTVGDTVEIIDRV